MLANSGSYGIFSEMNAQDRPKDKPDTVVVTDGRGDSFVAPVPGREIPGHMCFPPIATCITGAARLLLTMLERCVTERGGTYAFCDTDSLAIVATQNGGLVECPSVDGPTIRALSYGDCQEIRDRFQQLSPYDARAVPGLLKDEVRAYCLAVSAKRYALYNLASDGNPVVVPGKYSEHGLGHLSNPANPAKDRNNRRWIRDYWEWRIARYLGLDPAPLPWIERPAIGSFTVSSPPIMKAFGRFNDEKSYQESVKPFSFMMVVYLSVLSNRYGHARLVAPYEPDASKWGDLEWISLTSPDEASLGITLNPDLVSDDRLLAKNFTDIMSNHWRHPEAKFLGPDGGTGEADTAGLLQRRLTVIGRARLVGKESNKLEEVNQGARTESTMLTYGESGSADLVEVARTILGHLSAENISTMSHRPKLWKPLVAPMSERSVERFRAGEVLSAETTRSLLALAASLCIDRVVTDKRHRVQLLHGDPGDVLALHGYVFGGEPVGRECACGCGGLVTGRSRYVEAACRHRARRRGAGAGLHEVAPGASGGERVWGV